MPDTHAKGSVIEVLQEQGRLFAPPPQFAERANAQPQIYAEAEADWEGFWARQARELQWIRPFEKILEWDEPFAKWFSDGTLNASVNCLDRHVLGGQANRVAFFFEGEPGDRRSITYAELLADVCRFANGLRKLGIRKGDRVAIYMPMIVELPVAMLACARIGAAHSVIFGGFSPDAIVDRVRDAECVMLITADAGWRRGKPVALKQTCDEALERGLPSIEHVVVARRTGADVTMQPGRDVWWDDVIAGQPAVCEPEAMNAEDLLFLLYTSGTTAKPKGIKHTTAGYLTGVATTHRLVFDLKPDDVYWCTADIGWVTGHSYSVYGPLCNGATSVLFEGTPDYPQRDRFWELVERYKVTIFYTAPTAIRTFMKWGPELPGGRDLSSLRLLGSVGEPINPQAWLWYHEVIGGGRCPIVDTFWQTETGMIMITPLPGVTSLKPGSATRAFPGVLADIVNEEGESVPFGGGGYAVFKRPWPAMLRGIWGDDERYRSTYWSKFPHMYLIGDGSSRDTDGDFWFMGRIDDVMNISGHRISTAEVESAFVGHARVAEAAVVGKTDDVTGQAIVAYVSLRGGDIGSLELAAELRTHVASKLGKFVTPKYVTFTPELPKTRSGKIMRRLLRDVAEGRTLGDTTTLADSAVIHELQDRAKTAPSED